MRNFKAVKSTQKYILEYRILMFFKYCARRGIRMQFMHSREWHQILQSTYILWQAPLICRLTLALLLHTSLPQKLVLFSILVFKVKLWFTAENNATVHLKNGTNSNDLCKIRNRQAQRQMKTPGGDTPLYKSYRYVPPHYAILVWKRVYTLPILVWNRLWFSRELRECMNVFIVLIPNE